MKNIDNLIYKDIDFSHLKSFFKSFKLDSETILIKFSFSSHCVSDDLYIRKKGRKIKKENVNEELIFEYNNEERIFSEERYVLSKELPNLLVGLFENINKNITCFNTEKKHKNGEPKYFYHKIESTKESDYYIFFFPKKVKKKNKTKAHIVINIQSAYLRIDQLEKKHSKNKIKLKTIISKSKKES